MKDKHLLGRKIYSLKTVERIDKKMNYLKEKHDPITFLNRRLFWTLVVLSIFILTSKYSYFYAPIIAIIFYYCYEPILLDLKIKRRRRSLEKEIVFFLEMLILSMDSGYNLIGALEITTKNIKNSISYEFRKALDEIKLGKSINESFISLENRIPSSDINNIILILREENNFGVSFHKHLNSQLKYLKKKEMNTVKEIVNKMPTKVVLCAVLLFIPLILLLILSPVILNILN